MSTRGHLTAVLSACVLGVCGLSGAAHAAHLVKVDGQSTTQQPPAPLQIDGQSACNESSGFTGQGEVLNSQVALLDLGSFNTVSGTCEKTMRTNSSDASLTVTIISDSGDAQGPLALCFSASHSLAANSTGDGMPSASFGGNVGPPVTMPATITRSPGAITIFSGGPTTITSGTDADSRSGLFTANIGDSLTLVLAESTTADLDGTGSASAQAAARLSVNIGTCADDGAPAVSHSGLIVLAALLGALGMLTVGRRRFAFTRNDRGRTSA